jgi:uncharacterized membrane protein
MTIKTSIANDRSPRPQFGQDSHRLKMAGSILAGTTLAAIGIYRRSLFGTVLALGGGYLAYRGIEGNMQSPSGAARVGFTINRPLNEVYAFVRDPQNWKQVVQGCEIETTSQKSFRLTLGANPRKAIESEVWITDEQDNDFVAWSSSPGTIFHRGVLHVRPAAGNRGTELLVALEFHLPGGPLSRAIALSAGLDPEQVVRESLRRVKNLLEAGEIPTTVGQPSGARGMKGAVLRVALREEPPRTYPQQTQIASD